NYGVRVTLNNLFGQRQQLRATGQNGFTKKLSFDYSIPYLNKKGTFGMAVNYTYKTNFEIWYGAENNKLQRFTGGADNVFVRNYASTVFYYRPAFFNTFSVGLQVEE